MPICEDQACRKCRSRSESNDLDSLELDSCWKCENKLQMKDTVIVTYSLTG